MNYLCPVCQSPMKEQVGTVLHPFDAAHGIQLSCPSLECPAQEVAGHGDNAKEAWKAVQDKFVQRKDRD
jgi:hypothetical protein